MRHLPDAAAVGSRRAGRVVLAAGAAAALLALAVAATRRPAALPARAVAESLERLRQEHLALHDRLAEALANDPLARRVLAEDRDLTIAVRPSFVSALVAQMAHVYLSAVELDLGELEATAGGELHGQTLFGRVKAGEWRVQVDVQSLRGRLAAGHPRLRFGEGRIDVELPVSVRPAAGSVALDFSWDSSGVVNVLCRDFRLARELEGRVVAQRHVLSGAISVERRDGSMNAVPVFAEPTVPVRIDLSEESWAVVEQALRSQDSLGRCGLLLEPERVLGDLRQLAARGIAIRLPAALFQPARLPAQVEREVNMGGRALSLSLQGETMRVTPELLWSTASVQVEQPPVATE